MGSNQLSMSNASKLHACRLFYVSLGYPMVTSSHTIRVTPTWKEIISQCFNPRGMGNIPPLTSTPIKLIKGGMKLPLSV